MASYASEAFHELERYVRKLLRLRNKQNEFAEFLSLIARAREKHPHLRVGQIISNAICDHPNEDLFYLDDSELNRALAAYVAVF